MTRHRRDPCGFPAVVERDRSIRSTTSPESSARRRSGAESAESADARPAGRLRDRVGQNGHELADGDGLGLRLGDSLGIGLGDSAGIDAHGDSLVIADAGGEALRSIEADAEPDADADGEGLRSIEADADSDASGDGDGSSEAHADALADGLAEGLPDGTTDGNGGTDTDGVAPEQAATIPRTRAAAAARRFMGAGLLRSMGTTGIRVPRHSDPWASATVVPPGDRPA